MGPFSPLCRAGSTPGREEFSQCLHGEPPSGMQRRPPARKAARPPVESVLSIGKEITAACSSPSPHPLPPWERGHRTVISLPMLNRFCMANERNGSGGMVEPMWSQSVTSSDDPSVIRSAIATASKRNVRSRRFFRHRLKNRTWRRLRPDRVSSPGHSHSLFRSDACDGSPILSPA